MGILWVWDPVLGDEVTDRHEGIKSFCDGPGEAFLLGFFLHVARRHINSENVACPGEVLVLNFRYVLHISSKGLDVTLNIPSIASIAPLVSSGWRSRIVLPMTRPSSTS